MESAVHRLPVLAETGIRKFYNGPESFTPDNQFIIGEAPELPGFFVGRASTRSGSRAREEPAARSPSGSSRARPTLDLISADIRRFSPLAGNDAWLRERVVEVLGPALRRAVAQPRARDGPPAAALAAARPDRRARAPCSAPATTGNAPTSLRPRASRQRSRLLVGAADLGRLVRRGAAGDARGRRRLRPDVLLEVRRRRRGRRDVRCSGSAPPTSPSPVGRTVYTGHAQRARHLRVRRDRDPHRRARVPRRQQRGHHRARPRLDAGVTCPSVSTPASSTSRARMPSSASWDRARPTCCPRCRTTPSTTRSFPFGTSREVRLGSALVRATRITYVGELGWELYVPTELAVGVYDELFRAGRRPRHPGRRLLRHRGDAAREGLPRVRARADDRDRPGGGGADLRLQARAPTSTSSDARPSRPPGP